MQFRIRVAALAILALWGTTTVEGANLTVTQTNLVSNISGMAQITDPNLKDPWGISFTSGSPFWVSDQASNVTGAPVSTLYGVSGTTGAISQPTLMPNVPNLGNAPPDPNANGPTGQVTPGAAGITTNATTDFLVNPSGTAAQANFIFANLDGSIAAWSGRVSGNTASIEASVPGAIFSGLAIGNNAAGAPLLFAADQNSGNINVFNSKWAMTGSFTDPALPAGYTAFNVQNLGGTLFVTFTNQANPLGGIVDEFTTDGTLLKRLVTDVAGVNLQQPWGLVIAPAVFGPFGGDLLVGNNNGNGQISAFKLSNGAFDGTLTLPSGQPFSEGDLWALSFGNGTTAGFANTLYFTAGLASNTDGLFGSLAAVPEPSSIVHGVLALILGSIACVRRRLCLATIRT